ncbi:8141_t:CDS:2, partial [Racocetra fulgida]
MPILDNEIIWIAFTDITIELKTYLDASISYYLVASAIYNKLIEYWDYYFDVNSAIPVVLDPRTNLSNFSQDQVELVKSKFQLILQPYQSNSLGLGQAENMIE